MEIVKINQAKNDIEELVNQTNDNHQPILLSGTKGNAVLVSEDDWNSIQETLYVHSIPGIVESIIEGGNTPIKDCVNEDSIRDILRGY
ncbi:MAG: type II toxin-antitoxin system Phd/YefM family antitoxin [Crocosphaera sp.]|nr:type II toxin-antitoxin system Phd/YefM family antitoxin [Crocosphaera sp.]